jgi:NAD(P)-dependent dehydrogenase (short-subunit alcohol dehydrogenase family)
MKLANKVAVITGGNSGIGLATAHEFKANGAKIVILAVVVRPWIKLRPAWVMTSSRCRGT